MNLTAVLPVALGLFMGEVGGVVRRLREPAQAFPLTRGAGLIISAAS